MTATTPSSDTAAPMPSDPRAADAVDAFTDTLLRMRDGEELTVKDLGTTADLLQVTQAPTGGSPAAEAMPPFTAVFHPGRGSGTPAGRPGVSMRAEVSDVVH
jgi:hypothetical protein